MNSRSRSLKIFKKYLTALFVLFWHWNNQRRWTQLLKRVLNFFEKKSASGDLHEDFLMWLPWRPAGAATACPCCHSGCSTTSRCDIHLIPIVYMRLYTVPDGTMLGARSAAWHVHHLWCAKWRFDAAFCVPFSVYTVSVFVRFITKQLLFVMLVLTT